MTWYWLYHGVVRLNQSRQWIWLTVHSSAPFRILLAVCARTLPRTYSLSPDHWRRRKHMPPHWRWRELSASCQFQEDHTEGCLVEAASHILHTTHTTLYRLHAATENPQDGKSERRHTNIYHVTGKWKVQYLQQHIRKLRTTLADFYCFNRITDCSL